MTAVAVGPQEGGPEELSVACSANGGNLTLVVCYGSWRATVKGKRECIHSERKKTEMCGAVVASGGSFELAPAAVAV